MSDIVACSGVTIAAVHKIKQTIQQFGLVAGNWRSIS